VADTQNLITYPSYGPVEPAEAADSVPRIVYETDERIIEVWCISDLLSNSDADKQSSSEEKMKLLPIIFAYKYKQMNCEIEQVIAVGTASAGPSLSLDPPPVTIAHQTVILNVNVGVRYYHRVQITLLKNCRTKTSVLTKHFYCVRPIILLP